MIIKLGLSALAAVLASCCLASVAAATAAPPPSPLSNDIVARSIVGRGESSRLQSVMIKGLLGEPLSIAVIGGSITQGSSASSNDRNYGSLVSKWWKKTFPNSKVKYTNAGVGATGSDYAALRAVRDLGKAKPDFVIVEFAVNDAQDQACTRSMEGLVRQLLKMENNPAVLLLYTMNENGTNSQKWHTEIGNHYGLPMISMRDALYPEIQAGNMEWKAVEADSVHPNDTGHYYLAGLVTSFLEDVLSKVPADGNVQVPSPIPQPLYTDYLEHTTIAEGKVMKPTASEGWTYDQLSGGWKSKVVGSVLEFEVTGREIYLMMHHVNGPMGMAKVQVDQSEPQIVDCWFDQTWGTWKRLDRIASDLEPGLHKVRIEVLAEKNEASKGNTLIVNALGSAGL